VITFMLQLTYQLNPWSCYSFKSW